MQDQVNQGAEDISNKIYQQTKVYLFNFKTKKVSQCRTKYTEFRDFDNSQTKIVTLAAAIKRATTLATNLV